MMLVYRDAAACIRSFGGQPHSTCCHKPAQPAEAEDAMGCISITPARVESKVCRAANGWQGGTERGGREGWNERPRSTGGGGGLPRSGVGGIRSSVGKGSLATTGCAFRLARGGTVARTCRVIPRHRVVDRSRTAFSDESLFDTTPELAIPITCELLTFSLREAQTAAPARPNAS